MKVLGIETSCDDCSASIVSFDPTTSLFKILSLVSAHQDDQHRKFGGIVPEIAARSHLENIGKTIDSAVKQSGLLLNQIDGIAVTNRPGLLGSLLVGLSSAKTLAYALKKPLVAINHIEAHALSPMIHHEAFEAPIASVVVSGGHTSFYVFKKPIYNISEDDFLDSLVGETLDDAAGEALDKMGKWLDLSYPGGVTIDRISQDGDPLRFSFPKFVPPKGQYSVSYSGLKTAFLQKMNHLKKHESDFENIIPHLAASAQKAVLDPILDRLSSICRDYDIKTVLISGGVARNSSLRSRAKTELPVPCYFADPIYCTDNAAMIGALGALRFHQGTGLHSPHYLTLNAFARV